MVLVESIYSVLGDAAPLIELAALCAEHDALLVVDEAHGIGVHGAGPGRDRSGSPGSPTSSSPRRCRRRWAARAARSSGPAALREHLVNRARPFIFDTALAPAAAAGALAALRGCARRPELAATRAHPGRGRWPTRSASSRPAGAVLSVPMPSPQAAVAAAGRVPRARRAGRLLPAAVGARRHLAAADHGQRRACADGRLGRARSRPREARRGAPVMPGRRGDRHRTPGSARRSRPLPWPPPPPAAVLVVKPVQTGVARPGRSATSTTSPAGGLRRSSSSCACTIRSRPTPLPAGGRDAADGRVSTPRGSASWPWTTTR